MKNFGEAFEIYTFLEVYIMQFSEEVKLTLWNLIDKMSEDLSQFTVTPNRHFRR